MEIFGVIDRIEDSKVVVIRLVDIGSNIYLPIESFNFPVYEGQWVKIKILPERKKEINTKLKIFKLRKKLYQKNG